VETYHFTSKGINLYFNNERVDFVQVINPLVDIKGTNLTSSEQDLEEKYSGYKSKMGRNEMMSNFRYFSYLLEDEVVQYDVNDNGDVIGIWVSKNHPNLQW
jgi:hypothetical protein